MSGLSTPISSPEARTCMPRAWARAVAACSFCRYSNLDMLLGLAGCSPAHVLGSQD